MTDKNRKALTDAAEIALLVLRRCKGTDDTDERERQVVVTMLDHALHSGAAKLSRQPVLF